MPFNIPTQSLGEIFQNQYPFEIPKYQRGYAWEQEEVTDLIKDIRALEAAPTSSHFMGGIVHVYKSAMNPVSRLHEVVDGQQRMATFTLLVAAIIHGIDELIGEATRKSDKDLCNSHKEELEEAYLFYKVMSGGKRLPQAKLSMSAVDNEFFSDIVAGNTCVVSRETHRRIEQAYRKFRVELVDSILSGSSSIKTRLLKLVALAKRASNGFIVIHIVSHSRGEAYRLFSVLNDRGRNLSDGDLLRAKTLEFTELEPQRQLRIEKMWDRILDGSEEEIEKFLRAYYPSTFGKRAPKSGLYDAYELGYLKNKTAAEVERFVIDLVEEKRVFDSISKGIWPFPSSISKACAWDQDRLHRSVNVLRHEAAHPLLMSAYHLGEKKFTEILRFIERFIFRYINIVGAHPSPIYIPYYAEAIAIRVAPTTYSPDSLRIKLRELLLLRASDDVFADTLATKLQYSDDNARNRLIRHFLTTMESYSASANRGAKAKALVPSTMIVFDLVSTTLEHIYPQRSKPAEVDPALEPDVNRIGNLTILAASDNSVAGNDSFAKKKSTFASSSVSMNHEIAALTKWTARALANREKRIIELALKIFVV